MRRGASNGIRGLASVLLLVGLGCPSEEPARAPSEPDAVEPRPDVGGTTADREEADADREPGATDAPTSGNDGAGAPEVVADVKAVSPSGEAGDYTFEVTVQSPDTGCEQYADWWEVVSTDGELLARRVLAHSHTNEQPFTRSGGPVAIEASETVIVRAHMVSETAEAGYGGRAMRGAPAEGFEEADLEAGFAADLEDAEPQPSDCAF